MIKMQDKLYVKYAQDDYDGKRITPRLEFNTEEEGIKWYKQMRDSANNIGQYFEVIETNIDGIYGEQIISTEEEGIDMLEKFLFYNRDYKFARVRLIRDNTEEVNSPYDTSQGSREIELTFKNQTEEKVIIKTSVWIKEDEDDDGRYIGTSTHYKVYLTGNGRFIKSVIGANNKFFREMPNLSYKISSEIGFQKRGMDEEYTLDSKDGEVVTCSNCGKEFTFNLKDSEEGRDYIVEDYSEGIGIIHFCSKECLNKVHTE
jgi:hypothetical protein